MSIRKRARELYGKGHNARQWARAITFLRKRGLWTLDKGTPIPAWGHKQEHA